MKAAFIAFAPALLACAAEPAWNVRTELLAVDVSFADGIRLMSSHRNNGTAIAREIDQLIVTGRASITDALIAWARVGEHAQSEQIVEERYATDFEPPQVANTLGVFPRRMESPMSKARRMTEDIFAVPTAFETRNTGLTVEVDPIVSTNGRFIRLETTINRVIFVGMKPTMKTQRQVKPGAEAQPEFRTRRVMTTFTLESGQWALADGLPIGSERFHFVLIRATVIPSPS